MKHKKPTHYLQVLTPDRRNYVNSVPLTRASGSVFYVFGDTSKSYYYGRDTNGFVSLWTADNRPYLTYAREAARIVEYSNPKVT